MIQISKYEELENDINVGFRKHNFVVYGSIAKELVQGLTKNEILQKVYEIIKHSMDYEINRYNLGLPNSIIDNTEIEEVEEFIPEPSNVVKIELNLSKNNIYFDNIGNTESINIETILINQYNEVVNDILDINTSYGTIENDILTVEPTVEPMEVSVTATYGNISKTKKVMLYPYVEPIPPEPTEEELKIQSLEMELQGLQSAMAELTMMMTPQ